MHQACCDSRQTRRRFFGRTALGLAPLALASLMDDERPSRAATSNEPMAMRKPHFKPRAERRVIFLDMLGGPSQLDLFDPKPELAKRDGQFIPDSFLKKIRIAQSRRSDPG